MMPILPALARQFARSFCGNRTGRSIRPIDYGSGQGFLLWFFCRQGFDSITLRNLYTLLEQTLTGHQALEIKCPTQPRQLRVGEWPLKENRILVYRSSLICAAGEHQK